MTVSHPDNEKILDFFSKQISIFIRGEKTAKGNAIKENQNCGSGASITDTISHIMINIKMLMSTRYCVTHVSKTRRHFCVLTPRRHKKEIRTVSGFIFIHSFIRSFNRQPGRRRRVKKMKRAGGRRWRREMKKGGKREEDEDEGGNEAED